jgi:tetratricopeptide (TPR) repeat protein
VDYAEGRHEEAVKLLREVADQRGGAFEASDGIPAREMLADLLLELRRPDAALLEYEANLKMNPGRFDSLYGAGRAAELMGNQPKSGTHYAQLLRNCAGSASDRPELSHARTLLARWQIREPQTRASASLRLVDPLQPE